MLFGNNNTQLAKKLFDYSQSGRLIYCRHSALKPERASDTAMTIMQLLVANIIQLSIEESASPKAYVSLSLTDSCPNYLLDQYWYYINTVPQ